MEVSDQRHAPAHIGQETGWTPEPVWMRWWKEKSPAPSGTQTSYHPAQSVVRL